MNFWIESIRDVSWVMLFPPAMVETHGQDILLDAPRNSTTERCSSCGRKIPWS